MKRIDELWCHEVTVRPRARSLQGLIATGLGPDLRLNGAVIHRNILFMMGTGAKILTCIAFLALAGCAGTSGTGTNSTATGGAAPPDTATTVEEFDTSTDAEKLAATTVGRASEQEREIGHTIASLGNPTVPGFWLETPLISEPAKGRVMNPATNKSVAVQLLPIAGPETAGSRVSLSAIRLLGAPLVGLVDLVVFAG